MINNDHYWLVVSIPLKKLLSWDDSSQYMGKYKMFQTTNQISNCIFNVLSTLIRFPQGESRTSTRRVRPLGPAGPEFRPGPIIGSSD